MTTPADNLTAAPSQRYRLRFRKDGDLRFLGHRDILRTIERQLRRAKLKLHMSQGFHPKPKMSFPSALAVGVEGLEEVMEVELEEQRTADEVLAALASVQVPGLEFYAAQVLPPAEKNQPIESLEYSLEIPVERCAALATRIEEVLRAESLPVVRPGRKQPLDLCEQLLALSLSDGRVHFTLRVTREAGVRPREVLAILHIDDLEKAGCHLTRTAVHLKSVSETRPEIKAICGK